MQINVTLSPSLRRETSGRMLTPVCHNGVTVHLGLYAPSVDTATQVNVWKLSSSRRIRSISRLCSWAVTRCVDNTVSFGANHCSIVGTGRTHVSFTWSPIWVSRFGSLGWKLHTILVHALGDLLHEHLYRHVSLLTCLYDMCISLHHDVVEHWKYAIYTMPMLCLPKSERRCLPP